MPVQVWELLSKEVWNDIKQIKYAKNNCGLYLVGQAKQDSDYWVSIDIFLVYIIYILLNAGVIV